MRTGYGSPGWLACGCFCLLATQAFAQPSEKYLADDIQYFPVAPQALRTAEERTWPQRNVFPTRGPLNDAALVRSPEQRIDHLRQAAENLEQAGFGQEALVMRERAAQLERESRRPRSPADPLQAELRELRQSVDLLREEVHFLRRQLQLQLPFKGTPEVSQEGSTARPHEARIRLPDRRTPISDEELDEPESRDLKAPAEKQRPNRSQAPDVEKNVEFELVPLPYEDDAKQNEPEPTPASRPPRPNKSP